MRQDKGQLIHRRGYLQAVSAGLLGLHMPCVLAQAKPAPVLEKSSITVAISAKASLYYLPLTIAHELGFFKSEGLDVRLIEVADMEGAQQASLMGRADVVCGWLVSTLKQQSQNQFFQAFVLQCRAPQMALGVALRFLPGFTGLQDLRGKRVGIVGPGTASQTVAQAALARARVRRDDVLLVSVGSASGAITALRSGQIDALCYGDPLMTQLEQRNEIRIVADTRNLRGTASIFGGEMPSTCLYAPQEFVQKHPRSVQALTNAMVRALKWLQTAGVSDLMRAIPEPYFAGDRGLYLSAFGKMRDAISSDGLVSAEGAQNVLGALYRSDPTLRLQKISLERSYTNGFAAQAKQRFRV